MLFEASYEYQPVAIFERLWVVIDAPALVADRLSNKASDWNLFRELLTLSKQCAASRFYRLASTFVPGDL